MCGVGSVMSLTQVAAISLGGALSAVITWTLPPRLSVRARIWVIERVANRGVQLAAVVSKIGLKLVQALSLALRLRSVTRCAIDLLPHEYAGSKFWPFLFPSVRE